MMRSFALWKKILYLLLITLSFVGLQDFCHKKTQGFTLAKARSAQKHTKKQSLDADKVTSLRPLLSQPFYFLKKGLQCYVFISEDSNYVLKLFRWKELEPSRFSKLLPSSWTQSSTLQKQKKKELDFTSYQIAWDALQEETGLIFLHLEKTQGLDVSLCLYDPILVRHIVPADDIEFLLQKKVEPFLPFFEENKKCPETLFAFFTQLAQLLQSRVQKKISDSDISLQYNMGIHKGSPVLFDIGNLTKIEKDDHSFQENLEYQARLILEWLAEHSPELQTFFRQKLYPETSCEKP